MMIHQLKCYLFRKLNQGLHSGLGHSDASVMLVLKWLLALMADDDAQARNLRPELGRAQGPSSHDGVDRTALGGGGGKGGGGGGGGGGSARLLQPALGTATGGSAAAPAVSVSAPRSPNAPPLMVEPMEMNRHEELVGMVQGLTAMVAVRVCGLCVGV